MTLSETTPKDGSDICWRKALHYGSIKSSWKSDGDLLLQGSGEIHPTVDRLRSFYSCLASHLRESDVIFHATPSGGWTFGPPKAYSLCDTSIYVSEPRGSWQIEATHSASDLANLFGRQRSQKQRRRKRRGTNTKHFGYYLGVSICEPVRVAL